MRRTITVVAAGSCLALALGPADAFAHQGRHHRGQTARVSGTVASFSTQNNMLTIKRADNSMLTGLVTGRTQIKCERASARSTRARAADHGGNGSHDSGSGDQNGSGDIPQPQATDQAEEQNEPADQNEANNQAEEQNEPAEQPEANDQQSVSQLTAPSPSSAQSACDMGDLVPGAVVARARLRSRHGSGSFDQIRLAL